MIQAHCETDYDQLTEKDFLKSIKDYTIFKTKQDLNLLDKNIDEITMLEILSENKINAKGVFS